MASQEDTQEGDAKAQLLAKAFRKEGLDAGYWLPKVTQILGIQCREALQHLEYEDYLKLECEVQHPWEKKALQKLLKITGDKTASKEVQKKHLEKTKQRQEVAKQALKDLTEMLNSRSHSQDELRKKAETLWQAMEIPKERFWPSRKKPLGSLLERREFSSSAEESTFTKSMEQLGFSMSVSAKFAFWGINVGQSVDHSSSSQTQDTHQSHSEQSYFCTTKFQYIPLASCYFQRHQLRLSDAALRELQGMEQILGVTQKEDNPMFVKMCESFFRRFGSHINQGPLHFGGIFWWKASTEGFRAEERGEMKRQTSEALNSFVRSSYGGFLVSAAGALDVSKSNSQASVLGRAVESSHTAIQLYVVNTGGPADTTSLPQWKTGLVSDNTTWCVIDRGFELIPVWDVILCNHCRDFNSVAQMSRALRDAYKALSNESDGTIFGEELGSAVQEARDFMETVKAWEVTVVERKLFTLMELKDDLNAKTRNHSVWINVCLSHKALQDFLVNTVRSCQESPPGNTTFIKVMLKTLLDPHIYAVKDFPEASFIMQWIFQTEHSLRRSPKTSELVGYIKRVWLTTDDFERQSLETKLVFCPLVTGKAMVKELVDLRKKKTRSEIMPRLEELRETLLYETKRKCDNLIELQKEQGKLDARKLEDELLRRIRELGMTLKGKSLSERELKDNFTSLWNSWIAKVSRAARLPERVDIDAEIKAVLLEHFKEPGFHERIQSFPKGRGFSFDKDKHITKKKFLGIITGTWRSICDADVINFQNITDDIIARVKANIDKKEQEKRDYSRNFIHEILNEVQKGVDSVSNDAKLTFNREYSIDLSLYLCKMAAERFKAMHKAFQKANDPVVYLSSKREDFFQCFQISCQGAASITTFAGFLCDKIEPALCKAVFERTAKDIAEDMKRKFPDFRGNRANLEVCILRYLAEQENFEYFKQYLTSPKRFFQSYIERQVKSYCLDGNRRLRMFLESSLNLLYRNILSAVFLSTQIVKDRKDREDKISLWLDEFCRELTEVINLPRSDLKSIEHQEVTDIEFLSSAMAKALDALRDRLMKELADADMSSFSRQPHTILAEHFSGCWEQCPFCGAVCTNTIQKHDGAQVVFHRPGALIGDTWWIRLPFTFSEFNSHEMNIDTCSSLVASSFEFRLADHQWIPYKTYRNAGPPYSTWNILPDSSMQAYWKWFVSHFRTQLEDFFNGKFQGKGEIPLAWQRITKQEALSELERR
ncbi:LOW QUALITY PROTEIN: uncharacterized protein M8220_002018 [Acridotheres tristis]